MQIIDATSRLDRASALLAALYRGKAALHPTDTLPGLTFDPGRSSGRQEVMAFKGRPDGKPFLGLVANVAVAERTFAPMPEGWREALERLWPGPLSVVWRAASEMAPDLVAPDGTIGLRVPRFGEDASWMKRVLLEFGAPLPTTSVNRAGEVPLREWKSAVLEVAPRREIFVPQGRYAFRTAPSTVIRILGPAKFEILRAGAIPVERIHQALTTTRKRA